MAALRLTLAALVLTTGCTSGSGHPAPGDVLDEQGFWQLVDRAAVEGGAQVPDRAAVLAGLLRDAGAARLESWQANLVAADDRLNTRSVAAAFALVCGGPLDPEDLAAARSWVVAHGRATTTRVTADADALADLPDLTAACNGSGEPFQDVAVGRYSDLGNEPGGSSFPYVGVGPPHGPPPDALPRLRSRYG